MSSTHTLAKTAIHKTWIAIRFLVFGVGGMFWFGFYLVLRLADADHEYMNPFVALGGCFLAAIAILYGVGEWKRWAYIWVFLSMPLSLCVLAMLPGSSKGAGVMFPLVAATISYAIVRSYYRRRNDKPEDITHP